MTVFLSFPALLRDDVVEVKETESVRSRAAFVSNFLLHDTQSSFAKGRGRVSTYSTYSSSGVYDHL